jgi:subtilisin family serine protease
VSARGLLMPWARPCELYSAPGSVVVKLRLGEAPEAIPPGRLVRTGRQEPAGRFRIGPVDRILAHFADKVRITRVHAPAALAFDDIEQATGLARTFHVAAPHSCCVEDVVDALRMLHVVESASPQYLCAVPLEATSSTATDVELDRAWISREAINAPPALAYEAGDPSVVLAVLDTGVATHSELGGNVRQAGPDVVQLGTGDLANGLELLGDTSGPDVEPLDEVGHGTSCAGIVAARGERIAPGTAGECTVLPTRVLGSAHLRGRQQRIGVGRMSDIDEGVKRSVDLGAKVLNMSFGTPVAALDGGDPMPHADAVRYARARGCIVVAASGNSGDNESYTPACLDGVLAVGAVDDAGEPCPFSTRGAHVALAAPGSRVVTIGLDGYAVVSGTSFAAPFASAAAALLASRAARRAYGLDGTDAARILSTTVRPWGEPRAGHGAGVLDVWAALQALDREIDLGPRTDQDDPAEEERMAK